MVGPWWSMDSMVWNTNGLKLKVRDNDVSKSLTLSLLSCNLFLSLALIVLYFARAIISTFLWYRLLLLSRNTGMLKRKYRHRSFIMKCCIIKLSCFSNFFVAFIVGTIGQYPTICLCCRFINTTSKLRKQFFWKIQRHIVCGKHTEIDNAFCSRLLPKSSENSICMF